MSPFDFFLTEVNEVVARVFLRHAAVNEGNSQLSGILRGPLSMYGHTLPAKTRLRDLGAGPTHLAQGVVTDPCPWTPASPALYQLEARLEIIDPHSGNVTVGDSYRDEVGLRVLGIRGARLAFGERRTVLRGVAQEPDPHTLATLRAEGTTSVIATDNEPFLREASRQGVAVVLDWTARSQVTRDALRNAARHACVALVVLASDVACPAEIARDVPNLLLAEATPRAETLQPWARVAWVAADAAAMFARSPVPTIVTASARTDIAATWREQCDHLQAALAPVGQFAGYMIV
jgi:hypothetical protein